MSDAKHPIWTIAKALVILCFIAFFSYTNASTFDETEVKMIVELGVVLFGGAALESIIKARKDNL